MEFPCKEVTQNFKLNFLKKNQNQTKQPRPLQKKKQKKQKKNTPRLDFCPKPLDYVPLKFPLKNQSLIETKIICCSEWKKASKKKKAHFKIPKGKKLSLTESFSVFALSSKVYIREFYQNTLTAKVRPVYCLKISHLQKFISVKWKNVAVPPNRETFCPSKYFILYNNFLWNINFAS